MQTNYLESVHKQLQYYKHLGEKTMLQLKDEDLFFQPNDSSNSIAVIVKHLWGNMRSRWTDFLNTDGEKEWRDRDAEFESDLKTRMEVTHKWEEGWQCVFNALDSVSDVDLEHIVYIRNQGHTIIEVINRQLAHYAYHVGQIVFLGKIILDQDWISLSIAKNQSKAFNAKKFSQPKSRRHYTEDYLNNK